MVIKEKQPKKDFYSVQEVADVLGISRVAVLKRIKKGQLAATKVGRAFVIPAQGFLAVGGELSNQQKALLDRAVERVVREYGPALKQLGDS